MLDSDLRWRDPTRYEELRHRLHEHLANQIQSSTGGLQQRLLLDALFLHRMSPALRGAYDWDGVGKAWVEPAVAADRAGILAMVARHEGEEAAGWAEFWLDRQPAAFRAFRGAGGALLGFCCYLQLHDIVAAQDPHPLHEELAYLDYDRAPEADFTVGSRRFTAYAHDWRRRPLEEWAVLIDQHGASRAAVTPEPGAEVTVLVLSQPEFEESVRAALRDLSRPALLAGNPLLSSRLVLRAAAGAGSPEVLADVVRAAVEVLRGDPRDEKLHRAVDRTYLRPAMTQEGAAGPKGNRAVIGLSTEQPRVPAPSGRSWRRPGYRPPGNPRWWISSDIRMTAR